MSVTIDGDPAELVDAWTMPFMWDGIIMVQVKVPFGRGQVGRGSGGDKVGGASSPARGAMIWAQ